ncbi:MAG: lactate dehydrogenase [Planctomycetota bacterium]
MKISIIGLGRVGAAVGFVLTLYEQCEELVIINRTRAKAEAEALDLSHCAAFGQAKMRIRAGEMADAAGSDLVVLCASCPMPDKNTFDRMHLAQGNWQLYGELTPEIVSHAPDAIYLIVANPIDVLTYRVLKASGLKPSQVIGAGTIIDTARYRGVIAKRTGIHPNDVRGYVLGEHGDSQFPTISLAQAGGEPVDDEAEHWEAFEQAKQSAFEIYKHRGYTNYAIAKAVSLIVHTIRHDAGFTLPVSHLIEGYLGVTDVCVGLPCIVGSGGIRRAMRPALSEKEAEMFIASAGQVRAVIDRCGSNPPIKA